MTIWDAPVTELFGCQPDYPLNTAQCPVGQGFHNGVDYGSTVGTPVTVNGVTIGLSGATGTVTGPHCHVGHWGPNGVIAINPQDGKLVNGAKVTEVSSDSVNGKFVRVGDADGTSWVYLHMSDNSIVQVGQSLQGGSVDNSKPTSTQVGEEFQALAERQPTQQEVDLFIGLNWFDGQKQYLWPGVAETQQKVRNLEQDRDNNLYPYINKVTSALGLPPDATADDCVKAINALKTGTATKLKPGLYQV